MRRAIAGAVGLVLALAVPAGIALGRSRRWDRVIAPAVYALYPVPKIALLPIVMLLLGIGNGARIALFTLVLFFQVLVSARDAARAIPAAHLLSVQSLGATRAQAVRWVVLPALLPSLFSALRVGTGMALAVLFFSETLGTRAGLGYFVMESWMRVSYVDMLAGVAALGLLRLGLFGLIDLLQARLCAWERGVTARG